MNYTNSTTARERAVTALKSQLETITQDNGFFITIGKAFTYLPQRAETKRWPVFAIVEGPEKTLQATVNSLYKSLMVSVMMYAPPDEISAEDRQKFQAHAIADVEALVGNNWMLKTPDDLPNCRQAIPQGNDVFNRLDEQVYLGAVSILDLRYAQDILDPTISV